MTIDLAPLLADGDLLTRVAGQPAGVSRAALAASLRTYTLHAAPGSSEDIAFVSGAVGFHRLSLDVASCAVTFSGLTAGVPAELVLLVVQDATGGRAISLPAAVLTPNNNPLVISTGANQQDLISIVSPDGVSIFATVAGTNFG